MSKKSVKWFPFFKGLNDQEFFNGRPAALKLFAYLCYRREEDRQEFFRVSYKEIREDTGIHNNLAKNLMDALGQRGYLTFTSGRGVKTTFNLPKLERLRGSLSDEENKHKWFRHPSDFFKRERGCIQTSKHTHYGVIYLLLTKAPYGKGQKLSPTSEVRIGRRKMANRLGICLSSVKRGLKWLASCGLIGINKLNRCLVTIFNVAIKEERRPLINSKVSVVGRVKKKASKKELSRGDPLTGQKMAKPEEMETAFSSLIAYLDNK